MISWIWAAMWPNIFAPGFWTLLGLTVSHVLHRRHISKKLDEVKAHIDSQSG